MSGQQSKMPVILRQDEMNSNNKPPQPKGGDLCSRCSRGSLLTSPSGAHLVCSECRCITVTKPPRQRFRHAAPPHLEWKTAKV
jgi:hypothetical protein